MNEEERYNQGLHTRREVLGDEHVDQAQRKLNEFNGPFQEFITRYAWGEIWERPGLTRRERSLITLAILVSLHREPEFRMHIRAALRNGVTVEEIRELLMHAALYCGLPAANAAIHAAEEVILEATTSGSPKKLQMTDEK